MKTPPTIAEVTFSRNHSWSVISSRNTTIAAPVDTSPDLEKKIQPFNVVYSSFLGGWFPLSVCLGGESIFTLSKKEFQSFSMLLMDIHCSFFLFLNFQWALHVFLIVLSAFLS